MEQCLELSRLAFEQMYSGGAGGEAASGGIDGAFSVVWARRHRVLALLGSLLAGEGSATAESSMRMAYGRVVHSARLREEAGRITRHLQGRVTGLRLVKGPVLAHQAWPQAGLREFDDLDFRCDRHALDALLLGMSELGYVAFPACSVELAHQWHFGWGVGFRDGDGGLVEFNHRMFPPHFPWSSRLDEPSVECWESLCLDGCDMVVPTPALHLLLCCAHAVWHGWERLAWVVDIAGLLRSHAGILLEAEALAGSSFFLRESLHCGCAVASGLFGPLPGGAPMKHRQQRIVDNAVARLSSGGVDLDAAARRQLHRQFMSLPEQCRYIARWIATPGSSDFRRWGGYAGIPSGALWMLRWIRVGGRGKGDAPRSALL